MALLRLRPSIAADRFRVDGAAHFAVITDEERAGVDTEAPEGRLQPNPWGM